jgi:MYXO-CTERM domain-containing protein
MTLSTSSCSAKTVNCSTSADCPSGWTCVDQLQPATGVSEPACGVPTPADGTDAGAALPPECNPGPTPIPQNPQKQCAPPYSDLAGYGSGRSASDTGGSGQSTPAPVSATGGAGDPASKNGTSAASSGGCQLGSGGGSGGGAAWLALFGLVGLARRRRQTPDQPAIAKRR